MRCNLTVFLPAFVVVLLIDAVTQHYLPPVRFVFHHGPHPHHVPMNLHVLTINLISTLLTSVAVAPCMVAVHRHILLQADGNLLGNTRRLVYFAAWLCLFHAMPMLPTFLQAVPGSPVIIVVAYFLMVRLLLAFPSIALDTPKPFHDRWKRTKGHWWLVAATMCFALLPSLLLVLVIALVVAPQLNEAGFFGYSSFARIVLISIVGATIVPAVGAAIASELYLKFGGVREAAQAA
jgi:uncharacterized membrane protein YhaH (DUF805 family)